MRKSLLGHDVISLLNRDFSLVFQPSSVPFTMKALNTFRKVPPPKKGEKRISKAIFIL